VGQRMEENQRLTSPVAFGVGPSWLRWGLPLLFIIVEACAEEGIRSKREQRTAVPLNQWSGSFAKRSVQECIGSTNLTYATTIP
jgi:hypothetical protein